MFRNREKKNFTEGPLFWRISAFAIPIMLTGILQICYNMADNIVVGKFSGEPLALAAVGCTGSLSGLIINLLLGFAGGGAGVVIAQLYGAKDDRRVSRGVHTSMVVAVVGGFLFMAIGLAVSRPALVLMGTKEEVLELSLLYIRIIFLGIPVNSIYNFGAAILRSTGDSKTPLIILSSAGFINVALNIVFVTALHMTVSGVALATVISQAVSAVAVVTVLMRKKGASYRFSFSKLCFDVSIFKNIARYGITSGLQSAMFSVGNIFIASAVNTFPTSTITANTIVGNIDAITYVSMNSFSQAAMTFCGQNYGALKPDRIKKSVLYSLIQVVAVGVLVSGIEIIFLEQLINLYIDHSNPEAAVIMQTAKELATMLLITYIICGVMEVVSGASKGMGYVVGPMLVSIGCICGIRILWILVFFPLEALNSIIGLYITYPISWGAALIGMLVVLRSAFRNAKRISASYNKPSEAENGASK